MKPNATPQSLRFRYLPGFLLFVTAFGIFCIYGLVYGIGLELNRYGSGRLFSAKAIFLILLFIVGNSFIWCAIGKIWQTHRRFVLTPTHLIVVHWLRRERLEIPWESIVRVRKLPKPWWARGGGGLGVSVIETTCGHTIPFMTHVLLRYKNFLAELKARAVNCRSFEPYYSQYED